MFNYNIIDNPDIDLNKKTIDKIFEKFSNIVPEKQK